MIDLDSVVSRSPSALSAEVDSETVLMSIEHGNYYSLTRTSRDIWTQISQPVTVRQLCLHLAAVYQVPFESIQADTLAFLEFLAGANLLAVVENA
jgi:hypothetical protein